MPTPTNVFTSLGYNMKKREGGLGGGRSASPQSRMQAPLLTCNADSVQEKISNVILRDVNTVQNASYILHEKSRIYRCGSLGLDKKRVGGIGGRAEEGP